MVEDSVAGKKKKIAMISNTEEEGDYGTEAAEGKQVGGGGVGGVI